MLGKGSVNHNTRAFSAKNVDKERSRDNIEFCNKDIKQVYHELFGEALERYNAKQKRSDRKIENYYEKIRQGKQEKLFHEVIFQIGNKDDMNVKSTEGQLAGKILTEFMQDFQRRNPNLYVFSAHLHMDEETPHVHIDFVPYICNSKRGLDTRVSLKGALSEQGFKGGTRSDTEWNQWIENEKQELSNVMSLHGVQWRQLGTHNKHLSVLDFEKQERTREVEELSDTSRQLKQSNNELKSDNHELKQQQQKLQKEIENMADTKTKLERNVRAYDEDDKWRLPEPSIFTSAKSYCENSAKPLVASLKERIKALTINHVNLMEQFKKLTEKSNQQKAHIERYKAKINEQTAVVEQLQEKAADLERVEHCIGKDKMQGMIDSMKELEKQRELKHKNNKILIGR
jgi:uncharacterized protein YukE